MYKLTESVRNLTPTSVPSATNMQNYLNNTAWVTRQMYLSVSPPQIPLLYPCIMTLFPHQTVMECQTPGDN
jgi:hypothetical protein